MGDKLLIVEDNPQSMKMLQAALRSQGYIFLQATDGEEAIEVAVREEPDLIIMDIQLPKLSGLEVVKTLRQMPAFRNTPIIAVTAFAMKGDRERMIDAGFDAYLSKPFKTRELPETVARVLQEKER